MKNFYSSCWFERTKMLLLTQKFFLPVIFLLVTPSFVFADHALPVYHSPYHSSHFYKTEIYPAEKNLPVSIVHPLPVYRSPHHTAREYQSPTFSFTIPDNYTSSYNNYSSSSGFTVTDYTQRKPFEGTDISMLSSQNRLMRAPAEDDPPFPGDPGQMPVGDGLGFLLLAAAGYLIIKIFRTKKQEIS